ncbi:LOW QUALITY PROTEIN: hypothetical protein KUTeg_016019 [Tegillarca granosa]|uniref:Bromo domain-containing protein n=1 Tax=Tegillarca granosa TaxID=220873 RepID=A0ABQ9EKT6_TEGGR|nr:LOW QUALITY PROTEIN: hypothetical protein KUTeg_016019 [Tegillarca granosa]
MFGEKNGSSGLVNFYHRKMVRTRKSGEGDGDQNENEVSTEMRFTRKSRSAIIEEDDSEDSGVISINRRKTRADEDGETPPSHRSTRRKIEDESEEDENEDIITHTTRSARKDLYGMDTNVRRSSRQKKFVYGTFDQKLLGKALYGDPAYDESGRPTKKRRREVELVDVDNMEDMYSRVKRTRKVVKRDMYGMPLQDNSDDEDEEESSDESSDDEEEKESKKKREKRRPRNTPTIFRDPVPSPPRQNNRRNRDDIYRSPAHRKLNLRKKAAFHGSDSTSSSSSSSSSESSDEEKFQRRKKKSMARSRARCLPMNLTGDDISMGGVLHDRVKIGASLADVDPMTIDRSITFDSVGGLGKHIRALKEMIVFPLMYPEIFEKFKIAPPRGVLFYGPPGTGKTLVARALANECSAEEKRVAFFMRKGADCLSKWVGESERQLRLLFDQAYQMRPSIIFFDEIDGLAPVRSSRQDQIHSSIVSTLLALMDGLDSRGEVVVIGATNRLDSIDPALRRPGRFDREFLFPLPSQEARRQILHIHTKSWNPKLSDEFVKEVAEKSVGYCGADLKALCTEAALLALRRRYPQIYTSSEKLQIDVSAINISAKDFFYAIQSIVPASQRAVTSPARALSAQIEPLFRAIFKTTLQLLQGIFPTVLTQLSCLDAPDSPSQQPSSFLSFSSYSCRRPCTHKPRLLLAGTEGQGQSSYLAPAILHHMEQLPVHVLDLPALFAVSAKTPEESCAQIFREARRTAPSIVYMPHINQWWDVLGETLKATLLMLIQDVDPTTPLLLMATAEKPHSELDFQLQLLFDSFSGEVVHMKNPDETERREFFSDLILNQASKPPPHKKQAARRLLEVLPKAQPPEPRKLTERELSLLYKQEEAVLRELRIFLRDVLNKIYKDRKFHIFAKPVDIEDVPDYYEIIEKPMDMARMMSKIDLHQYQTVKEFLDDINLICSNALEYNPATDAPGRAIRHRACALKDTALAIINAELDTEFEKKCEDIVQSRKRRDYLISVMRIKSRRLQGKEVEPLAPLEMVEKEWSIRKNSPKKNDEFLSGLDQRKLALHDNTPVLDSDLSSGKKGSIVRASQIVHCSNKKPLKKKEIWGAKGYRKRKRSRNSISFIKRFEPDEENEHESDIEIVSCSETEAIEDHASPADMQGHSNSFRDRRNSNITNEQHSPTGRRKSTLDDDKQDTLSVHERTPTSSSQKVSPSRSPDPSSQSDKKLNHTPKSQDTLMATSPNRSQDVAMTSPNRSQTIENKSDAIESTSLSESKSTSTAFVTPSSPCTHEAVVECDSGVGSSVDSNGDSVDSVEQAKQLSGQKNVEKVAENTDSVKEQEETPAIKDSSSPVFRVTRSRLQTKQQERALAILEEPVPPLIIDKTRLNKVLDNLELESIVQRLTMKKQTSLRELHVDTSSPPILVRSHRSPRSPPLH